MKKIAIIGAGISGLSLAWYLKKRYGEEIALTLFEKEGFVGGLIQTRAYDSSLYELGPHSFRSAGSGKHLVALIEELGICDAVLASHAAAKKKYLARHGQLVEPWKLFFPLAKGMLHNLCTFSRVCNEETIAQFFCRRYGKTFCNTFINPLVRGIWAGDPEKLSMKCCFPQFRFFQKKSAFPQTFSFYEGASFLLKQLAAQVEADIVYNTAVMQLVETSTGVEVVTEKKTYCFDRVYLTIPSFAAVKIFPKNDPLIPLLQTIPFASLTSVTLGYKKNMLSHSGFGFLCSSLEEKELLGCVFDSAVFPQHNGSFSTRLTMMMQGNAQAVDYAKKYLEITQAPDFVYEHHIPHAIAQYTLGHAERLRVLEEIQAPRRVRLLGASFYGSSVGDCIRQAYALAVS